MPAETLDLREMPPPERHPKIHDAFERLDSGETLRIVNDHEPKPLFYEMQAEVDAFDAEVVTAIDSSMATAYAIDNEIERPELAHWMNDLGDGHDIQQITVTAADLVGKTIEEVNEVIPGGCLVAEVGEGSEARVPEPDHRLSDGEVVTFLGDSDAVAKAVQRFHPRE